MFNKCFSSVVIIFLLIIISFPVKAQILEKKEFRLKNQEQSLNFSSQKIIPVKPIAIRNTKKSLLFAGGLSFIVPGLALGQFYKEEFINGGIRAGISGICVLWFLLSPTYSITGDGPSSNQKIYAALLFTANWLASVVDALIPSKHNSYSKYRKYKLSL
jgi:TM2 domain-containing membrane protein YozV